MAFKPLKIAVAIVFGSILLGAAGAFIYWRTLVDSPQYSLAVMIDAARRGDDNAINAAIDTDAIVEDFVPQVAAKAAEMYGRGLPPAIIAKLASVATPVMPAVKERARIEVPRLIREQSARIEDVPFVFLVFGADRYFDVKVYGDRAIATSTIEDRPFELTMSKQGDSWKVIGVKDEQAATEIARHIGQEIIAFAMSANGRGDAGSLGVGNLNDLLKQAEELLK